MNYGKITAVSQVARDYAKWVEPLIDSKNELKLGWLRRQKKDVDISSVAPSVEAEPRIFKQ